MKQKTKLEKFVISACLILLYIFLVSIMVFTLTRQVLIKKLGVHNEITKIIMSEHSELDNEFIEEENLEETENELKNVRKATSSTSDIDWEREYPFANKKKNNETTKEEIKNTDSAIVQESSFIEKYKNKVFSLENKIKAYATEMLFGYDKIVEIAKKYDRVVRWNFTSYSEYGDITDLSDGYITTFINPEKNTNEQVSSIKRFKEFCDSQGSNFIFVLAPHKICEYEDTDVSGSIDYSNQNANTLLYNLESLCINTYDIRKTIHEKNLEHHELFYRTDLHWKIETGLWAAQRILEYCNENLGWNTDLELLNEDKFYHEIYDRWFLGSDGKKLPLSHIDPDDFTLLYPKYETKFRYIIPDMEIDEISDYSIVYNMDAVKEKNYYGLNPYAACNYGNRPLIKIENLLKADDHSILIIHDSFCNCVLSSLALGVKRVDSLDLRVFNGSVETYIRENPVDLVLVCYFAGVIGGEIDPNGYDMFDFR